MSGFGAPSLMPTPTPARAMSLRVPATTDPRRIASSIATSVMITTSAGSAASRWRVTPTVPKFALSLCPDSFSKASLTSTMTAFTAPALRTLISAASPTLVQTKTNIAHAISLTLISSLLCDLDDARFHRLEPIGHQRIVTGHDQPPGAGQPVDRLEGGQHFGQVRDDLNRLAGLDVPVEVRRVGRQHDRPPRRLHRHDLQPRRVTTDAVDADAGRDLAIAVEDAHAVGVVQRDEIGECRHVGRLVERGIARPRARPERHLVLLHPELGAGKQAVAGPVIVVQVSDDRGRDLVRLDADALDDRSRAHVVADAARAGVVFLEAGIDDDRLGPAEDEPDEVVQRELVVGGLAMEELAGGGVPLAVLERVDLVHDCLPCVMPQS